MSKELSHPAVTTESTYIDIGADTPEGFSISSRSRSMAREAVGNSTPEDRIRQRCSIAVGDWGRMADLLRFTGDLVATGLAVIAARVPIFTDIRMDLTSIQKRDTVVRLSALLSMGPIFQRSLESPGAPRDLSRSKIGSRAQ